ncbi:hypothetical protein DY000_02049431 [Brassica cretica]|uniref:Secreted protein n=1 Tax=Brassica cretica TaxID=69181 RepID=A0ABQ7F7Q5_BRACR|nr:hypothetical protein DY000_02049431 [Brassica cretica]
MVVLSPSLSSHLVTNFIAAHISGGSHFCHVCHSSSDFWWLASILPPPGYFSSFHASLAGGCASAAIGMCLPVS